MQGVLCSFSCSSLTLSFSLRGISSRFPPLLFLYFIHTSVPEILTPDKFLKGIAKEDECREEWESYQVCMRLKLAAIGMERLLREDSQEDFDFDLTVGGFPNNNDSLNS